MDTSPTLSIGGSRARAALLTTSGTGTGSTDRRVVFLASQPAVGGGHETKTWPHHWSPHAVRVLHLLLLILPFVARPRKHLSSRFHSPYRFLLISREVFRIQCGDRFNEKNQVNQRPRQEEVVGETITAFRLISFDIHRKNNRSMAINLKMFKRFRG